MEGSFIPGPTGVNGNANTNSDESVFVIIVAMSYGGRVYDVPVLVDEESLNEIVRRKMAPPPASKEALDGLKRRKLEHKASLEDSSEAVMIADTGSVDPNTWTCSICLCLLEASQEVIEMPCKHIFHSECLEQWLHRHNTCPLCRTRIAADLRAEKSLRAAGSMSDDEEVALPLTEADLSRMARSMTVHQLKQSIRGGGWTYDDCVEKTELLLRFLEMVTAQRRANRQNTQ